MRRSKMKKQSITFFLIRLYLETVLGRHCYQNGEIVSNQYKIQSEPRTYFMECSRSKQNLKN